MKSAIPALGGGLLGVLGVVWIVSSPATRAQATSPVVVVLSPTASTEVSGRTLLSAEVQPASVSVRQVEFFVDGRPVCTVLLRPFRCDWDAGDVTIPRSVRAVALLSDGSRVVQTVRTKSRGQLLAFRTRVDMIPVPVVVTDGGRRFIRGLTKDDFRVREDDTVQNVTFFEDGLAPAEIVLALDISGSMGPVLPDLRSATRSFLETLRPNDSLTLTAFNTRLAVVADRDAVPEDRFLALDRLRAGGTTALFDILLDVVGIAQRQTGRRAAVVFTDGEDTTSRASLERVRAALLQADVTLFFVVRETPTLRPANRERLSRLAAETGGVAVFARRIGTLRDQFAEILQTLSNQYVLSYIPHKPLGDGAWRKIDVELVGAARRYGARSREGYFAVTRVSGEVP